MKNRLIVALDRGNKQEIYNILSELDGVVTYYKVGIQIFTLLGPDIVYDIKNRGHKVFLDLKFHDIPNTVANGIISAIGLGVDMLTIHTLGGFEMMETAMKAAWEGDKKMTNVIGVTMLTSLSDAFLMDILGVYDKTIKEMVLILANSAKSAGLDGVVASVNEVKEIKKELGKEFIVITPGIRPIGDNIFDQVRVSTPEDAIRNGSDYLVVGRPILDAKNRAKAATEILEQMNKGKNNDKL